MEDDNEVLDWGNEDDEQQILERNRRGTPGLHDNYRQSVTAATTNDVDDAEDAVSLGGEEEDAQEFNSLRRQELPSTVAATLASFAETKLVDGSPQVLDNHPASQPVGQHQRRGSGSSSRARSRANSAQSPQRPLIHALPPKPVAASVPFLPPSHPSIIEATAMSRGREKSKTNGTSPSKPLSSADSSGDPPLPPDWEVRYPRNGGRGQYYYNARTHESTWTRPGSGSAPIGTEKAPIRNSGIIDVGSAPRPTLARDESLSARRSPPPVRLLDSYRPGLPSPPRSSRVSDLPPAGPLSYEDRHYRPGEEASVGPRDSNGLPPPVATHDLPAKHTYRGSRSPSPRPQDNPRNTSARQPRTRRASRKSDARDDSPARHWVAPDMSSVPVDHSRRREQSPQNDRHGPEPPRNRRDSQVRTALPETAPVREQIQQSAYNDSQSASVSPRHRSPLRMRDREPAPEQRIPPSSARTPMDSGTSPNPTPSNSDKPRDRPSRFDRPVSLPLDQTIPLPEQLSQPVLQQRSYTKSNTNVDSYVLSDVAANRSTRGEEKYPERRDRDEAHSSFRPNEARIDRQPQTPHHPRDSRDAAPPNHPPHDSMGPPAVDNLRISDPPSLDPPRRNRAPLPPQNAQFREVKYRDQGTRKKASTTSEPTPPPAMPRDRSERAPPPGPAPPSGPRSRDPPPAPYARDGPNDTSRRPPPMLPSNTDRRFEPDQRGPPKVADMDVDVDRYSAPRARTSPSNDAIMRTPSGGHTDNIPSAGADVPRGPRAMVSPNLPSAPSPSASRSAQGPPSGPWSSRERSPPPHLVRRDHLDDRDPAPQRYPLRNEPPRYPDEYPIRQPNDMPPSLAPRATDSAPADSHPRREPREPRRGRRDGPLSLSGANIVPITNSRFASSSATSTPKAPEPMAVELPSDRHPASADAPSVRHHQGYPVNDARGRELPAASDYRNDAGHSYHTKADFDGRSPREPPIRGLEGGPHSSVPRSNFNDKVAVTDERSYPRPQPVSSGGSWPPTEEPRNDTSHGSRSQDDDIRPPTPPPQSRAPSQASTGWPQGSQERSRSRSRDPPTRARRSRFGEPVVNTPPMTQILWPPRQESLRQEPPRREPPRQEPLRQEPLRQDLPRREPPPPDYRQDQYDAPDSRRSGSLQGRLAGRYEDERTGPTSYRPHSPVESSSMRRRDQDFPRGPTDYSHPSDGFPRERSPRQGNRGRPNDWQPPRKDPLPPPQRDLRDPPRAYPEAHLPPRPPQSSREEPPRRVDPNDYEPQYLSDSRDPYPARPQVKRTGGSLLDRLSFDRENDVPMASEDVQSTSLRDRVQLPAKRDRDDLIAAERNGNGSGVYERGMDYEGSPDTDVAAKRRRRSGRAKRGKRGAQP